MYVGSSNECNKLCITASGSGNCSGVFLRNCLVFSFGSVTWADEGNTSYITQWKYLRPCQLWWMMNAKFKVGDCVRSADNPLDIIIYSIFIYFFLARQEKENVRTDRFPILIVIPHFIIRGTGSISQETPHIGRGPWGAATWQWFD